MATIETATIFDVVKNKSLWAPWFRDPATWRVWFVFLRVLFGLPLEAGDVEVFRECTGRSDIPTAGFFEAWLICGRRSGKSFILALIAVFLAVFRDWSQFLIPGERGVIKIIATDRRQARVIHRYCRALLQEVEALAELVQADNDDEIVLTNGIVIEIQTASFRTVRGYTVIAALLDELAFWRSDDLAANPDSEIIAALRPAMATVRGGMLLVASSPYARRGELYRAYRRHHGKDGAPVLCWRAATRTMNPTVPQSVIDEALEDDSANAAAEYLAEFRTDIETFISREALEAVVIPGRVELPRVTGVNYAAFCDPSGGSGDSFTIAIAHAEGQTGVLDYVCEVRPPLDPGAVIGEFAKILRDYGLSEISGDRYGGQFAPERFREHGIVYNPSERPKSDIYKELLPLINSRKIELLDHPRLLSQLGLLERRVARSGKDSIDHPPGGHDDVANACAGVLVAVAGQPDIVEQWTKFSEAIGPFTDRLIMTKRWELGLY
jgi:hypothetical protein